MNYEKGVRYVSTDPGVWTFVLNYFQYTYSNSILIKSNFNQNLSCETCKYILNEPWGKVAESAPNHYPLSR